MPYTPSLSAFLELMKPPKYLTGNSPCFKPEILDISAAYSLVTPALRIPVKPDMALNSSKQHQHSSCTFKARHPRTATRSSPKHGPVNVNPFPRRTILYSSSSNCSSV
ncbi:hypothetical protein NL676_001552 [Syzygium grande]|nr:hypothetical protein NL676_001552 [Syzygium grande]